MKRFVRIAAIGFTLFSVLYWDSASGLISLARDYPDALGLPRGSYLAVWLVYALPVILYGMIAVLFFHWFAKRVARMGIPGK